MANDGHRERIGEIHQLVAASSENAQWGASPEALQPWQREVLTRILLLTSEQEIQYLSSAQLDEAEWDFVAFTHDRLVRVLVTGAGTSSIRFDTSTFSRSSLESLELLDVGPIPAGDEPWPSELNLLGHYHSASISLPLDKFASKANRGELKWLLQSLLQDLVH